jgi:hypothetical protein
LAKSGDSVEMEESFQGSGHDPEATSAYTMPEARQALGLAMASAVAVAEAHRDLLLILDFKSNTVQSPFPPEIHHHAKFNIWSNFHTSSFQHAPPSKDAMQEHRAQTVHHQWRALCKVQRYNCPLFNRISTKYLPGMSGHQKGTMSTLRK